MHESGESRWARTGVLPGALPHSAALEARAKPTLAAMCIGPLHMLPACAARSRLEAVLVGLEDELAALDLRHAALLHAADEQVACRDGGAACTVRPVILRYANSAGRKCKGAALQHLRGLSFDVPGQAQAVSTQRRQPHAGQPTIESCTPLLVRTPNIL